MMNDDPNNGGCIGCILWLVAWAVIIWVAQAILNATGIL